jgi:L-threonylcarbamoyladenylate synthase
MLEDVIGKVVVGAKHDGIARSPGQMARHYSPRTPLRLVESDGFFDDFLEITQAGKRVGVVAFRRADSHWLPAILSSGSHINLTDDPQIAASHLYDTLHQLDQLQLDVILVEEPPETPKWAAIRDRLKRAASP